MPDLLDHDPDSAADAQRRWVAEAVGRHERALLGYVAHLIGSAERARDVVQEAFARLCAQRPAEVALPEWLFVVCRNLAVDRLRKERRMSVMDEQAVAELSSADRPDGSEASTNPAVRLVRADESRRLIDLLATLPPRQQEAVRLKFQQDLSYAQIATTMGTNAGNVAVLVHAGLKSLRERMGN